MYLFQLVFLFYSDVYPGVKLLDHMVVVFPVSWGISILFSTVATPIRIPTKTVGGVPFLYILDKTCLCVVFLMITILTGMRWYLIVVWICIFLMINDVKHLFTYLLAICVSSLKKKSVWVFLSFFNWVVYFLILSCVSCLYILDINPLSVISFADSFSHSVNCWWFHLLSKSRQWHPTPVLLPGKSHGQRSLVGCSPWVAEGRRSEEHTSELQSP